MLFKLLFVLQLVHLPSILAGFKENNYLHYPVHESSSTLERRALLSDAKNAEINLNSGIESIKNAPGEMNLDLESIRKAKAPDGWFREESDLWPGQAMSLQKFLHAEKSKFQDVLVFESTSHGKVLVLDGAIQCVENDEFSYHEMIAHLPLNSHPNPEHVLVIGGGDGCVLREVLKHPSVKTATLVDIDEAVPRVSKAFLPNIAAGFNDPRVTVHIGDGFQYLRDQVGKFDVIITDSSDPNEGPAQALFCMPYFELLKNALKPNGSITTQGECIWLHLPLIHSLIKGAKDLFPKVKYAYISIPTYPSGTIGFVICSLDKDRNLKQPLRQIQNTRYYNIDVHASAFVLPEFSRQALEAAKTNQDLPHQLAPKSSLSGII